MQVVDCLLPGQVKFLGNRSYITPRRPTRTTASDCKIRGGEFVAFDRADYKTALSVWMPSAQKGNAEAQVNVGEIYERGVGGNPNYAAALIWYSKAAKQGNIRAKFNLGTLYEQGLGVEKSMLKALNWYRQAWGIPENDLMYSSAYASETKKLKTSLQQEILKRDRRISVLQSQVASIAKGSSADKEMLAELNEMIAEMQSEKSSSQKRVHEIRERRPSATLDASPASIKTAPVTLEGKNFGRYFALVIGNQNYQSFDNLVTPLNDVQKISQVLKNQYGFEVSLLNDADNITIMDAINNLNSIAKEGDNVLIYYAGHGSRLSDFNETGSSFWLPINADLPPRDTFWISSEFVTRHIARLKAKRVLIVADSCFSGLLSSAPGYLLLNKSNAKPTEEYLNYKLPRRSRLLLSSGGDRPVLDSGGGNYSVFAKAFIDVLEKNKQLITGPEVFMLVKDYVVKTTGQMDYDQVPAYSAIKGAGHEVGDFFFVPSGG